ncbi:MAG: hypothetical protein LBP98_03995 [Tannerella sp.]|nr:hypothetical protein [Tannerella sp.]
MKRYFLLLSLPCAQGWAPERSVPEAGSPDKGLQCLPDGRLLRFNTGILHVNSRPRAGKRQS